MVRCRSCCDCGRHSPSDWNGFCSQFTFQHTHMGRSASCWIEHPSPPCSAKIWYKKARACNICSTVSPWRLLHWRDGTCQPRSGQDRKGDVRPAVEWISSSPRCHCSNGCPNHAVIKVPLLHFELLHNLFLHSALVMSRKISHTVHGINTACRYFLIESGLALFFAFIINVAVMSVTGTICNDPDLSSPNIFRCANITLNSASFLLKDALGKWSSKVYAISLLASGQSSTVTGTYAGQYIMQGFLDVKMEPWLRNLLTRSIAITPSLVAAIIGGSSGASRLIIIASMILSFALPFALIPLLKFTSSKNKMGHQKNSLPVTLISWALGFCFIGNNLYFLSTALIDWLRHSSLPKIGSICIAAIFFLPGMMLYVGLLIYLTLRKEATVKCLLPSAKNVITTDQIPSEWELHVNSPRTQELEEDIKEDPQSLHPQEIKNYP
ncbi:metal transporter Nramp7.2-like isoform X3 [Tasmannia lanceolata]|uniref:metal transporter Nramp7.2-like isoform X3 n=1 Tax=Tasmannia lanceolata TaxID=3420 RepID=UPI0040637235